MSSTAHDKALDGLVDAHAIERIVPYLREVWNRRPYIWYVSVSELRSRQIHTVLGNLWHILNPILTVAIYYLIFGLLLDVNRGVDNTVLFLTIGIFLFQLTQRSTMRGANSIVTNEGLIKTVYFPRAILPLSAVVTELLAALSSFGIIYVVALLTGETADPRWVLLLPVVGLLTVFDAGVALVAARATTHVRDTVQVLPFAFRLLFYGSGVIFNVSAYAGGDRWIEWLFVLNPLYDYITVARWTIMGGSDVTAGVLVSGMAWTLALAIGGFAWFRAGEHTYARD